MTDFIAHAERLKNQALSGLAKKRLKTGTVKAAGWTANLTRHRLDLEAEAALLNHAATIGTPKAIKALFQGEHVNPSEDRPALHWALRANEPSAPFVQDVHRTLIAGDAYADRVRSGDITAASGQRFTNIVHIGIGGSDFGPRLLADAFEMERDRRFTLRFCANLDPIDLDLALDGLDPAETLVIGVSKSFGTEETLYNLTRAKAWLEAALGDAVSNHIALVTSRPDRAREWLGTSDVTTFDLPESVGGRFSIWSNGSLALRIALGPEIIDQFREGAAEMDAHFETEPLETNLPVRLALIDYWNRNALAASMRVLLAYSRRLRLLPAYLQQLEMESNGKSVSPEGKPLPGATAPALWGGEGSVGQHSYHQWLHQGTEAVPTEFILATDPKTDLAGRTALTAHALAQAEVLANGRVIEEVQAEESDLTAEIAAQKVHAGNRPSTFLYTQDFGPASLGALIALFEHRVFISGKLWQINSFDQWGVERGKTMAGKIKQVLTTAQTADDPITANLSHDLKLG